MTEPSRRVVVAEDSASYRAALTRALAACDGLEIVDIATDGASAVESIVRHAPDIAVLDWRMPEMDGVQVCERLRELGVLTMPVILSAEMDDDLAARARSAGAMACLSKSMTRHEICAALLGLKR